MCDCNGAGSRQAYAEFAFRRPFPYGFERKMAARTVYHARKLEVWVASEKKPTEATHEKLLSGIETTLKTISRLAGWSALCVSPSFRFVFDAEKYPDVYEPAEDSFLLADTALAEIRKRYPLGCTVLEMGCGSGIISYIIRKQTGTISKAVDINPSAVECAANNGIEVMQSDLFENVRGKFDLIVFNPPYLPDDTGEPDNPGIDRALYGGTTGQEVLNRFFSIAKEHLSDEILIVGEILIVISTHTGVAEVKEKAKESGYNMNKIDEFENLSTWRLFNKCG